MSEQLSKQERRQMKIEQRREDKLKMQQEIENKGSLKKYAFIAVAVLLVGAALYFFAFVSKPSPTGNFNTAGIVFPLNNIHWHAVPQINLCGEQKPIPTPGPGLHLGNTLFHTHEDAQIHIEGTVAGPEQITLGGFFDNIGVKFSSTEIMDKKNGDICNGNPGTVQLLINGSQNTEFRDYVVRDKDKIQIMFE